MDFNENIREKEDYPIKTTQDNAKKKAIEHTIGIREFINWLFVLNSDEIEISINEEHKLLIINGIRSGQKFIYRYFFFGRDGWNVNDENDWYFYKTEYIKQLKIELPKIKWNDNISDNTLAHIHKKDMVGKFI